jgi:hypothetical protein
VDDSADGGATVVKTTEEIRELRAAERRVRALEIWSEQFLIVAVDILRGK